MSTFGSFDEFRARLYGQPLKHDEQIRELQA
jgi:hypothetical protein